MRPSKPARDEGVRKENEIFRKCHVRYYKFIEGAKDHYYEADGKFHQWASEPFEESFVYTVGIVELEDGTIVTSEPRNINFKD